MFINIHKKKAFSVKRDNAKLGGMQINRNAEIILSLAFNKIHFSISLPSWKIEGSRKKTDPMIYTECHKIKTIILNYDCLDREKLKAE